MEKNQKQLAILIIAGIVIFLLGGVLGVVFQQARDFQSEKIRAIRKMDCLFVFCSGGHGISVRGVARRKDH